MKNPYFPTPAPRPKAPPPSTRRTTLPPVPKPPAPFVTPVPKGRVIGRIGRIYRPGLHNFGGIS